MKQHIHKMIAGRVELHSLIVHRQRKHREGMIVAHHEMRKHIFDGRRIEMHNVFIFGDITRIVPIGETVFERWIKADISEQKQPNHHKNKCIVELPW